MPPEPMSEEVKAAFWEMLEMMKGSPELESMLNSNESDGLTPPMSQIIRDLCEVASR